MLDVLQLDAKFLADDASAGDDGDVIEDGLAAIAEARRLHGGRLQRATQLVDDQRGERLAFEILGDDQERPAFRRDLLEDGQQVLERRDLLVVEQNRRVLQHDFHAFGVGHEVGREVAAVELHPFDDCRAIVSMVRPSSTVMTPSLPTFSIASAMIRPIVSS